MPNVTAKTLQSPNAPNVAAETSQDVNTPDISKTSSHLFSVPKASAQTNKILPAQKEQSQTSTDNAHIDKKLPQDSSTSTENSNSEVQRQLRLARIATPKDQNNQRSKSELQRLIEQIRNIEFKPQNQSPEPIIVVEPLPTIEPPAQTAEPDEMLSDTELPEEPEGKEIDSKLPPLLPCEPVTSQTLQMLENLSQHPDQLDNPFALAELLYLSGHLKEASVFYQEALNRSSPDRADPPQNRAWILFQIGNCLRDDDPPMATKMYRQLIAEYPNSLWTGLAKTQDKLIDWYQKNKPQTLIAEKQL
ncbi:MAG: tetratricopeptide repeat protein [Planctomycetota bacterium]